MSLTRIRLIISVLDSLVARGLTPHVAWRVSFVVVPFIIVMFMAIMILFFAPDTPTGKWKDRHLNDASAIVKTDAVAVVDVDRYDLDGAPQSGQQSSKHLAELEKGEHGPHGHKRRDSAIVDNEDVQAAEAQLIKKPSPMDVVRVFLSLPTITQCACYFVTFGCELSINGILGTFYIQASGKPAWTQTESGNWAAMYGLLNVVTRPLGGYIADMLYLRVGVEGKKYWMLFCKVPFAVEANLIGAGAQGIVLICIGAITTIPIHALIGAMAVAAIFTEASNGANFAVVPHVHPANNGIVSGLTGACGNVGGIIFNLVFRFLGTDYHKAYWIIGIISVCMVLSVSWIPVPKVHCPLFLMLTLCSCQEKWEDLASLVPATSERGHKKLGGSWFRRCPQYISL